MAKSYSIYEAKAHFSEVIRLVKQHARVVITHRGTPIAQILPIEEESPLLSERIEMLAKESRVSPAPATQPSWTPVAKRKGALKRFLEERD